MKYSLKYHTFFVFNFRKIDQLVGKILKMSTLVKIQVSCKRYKHHLLLDLWR